MIKFGKTIKLFLIDGEPNGRMSCELSKWTGKAYKIPRKQIKESSGRLELHGTGIYILFGKADSTGQSLAYIGEAEGIHKRLTQHLSAKDFWNEAIVFVSKDENLNKAHIKYIESRLYEIAITVNRYELENSNIPPKPKISESDEAEMEEFISNIGLLVLESRAAVSTSTGKSSLFLTWIKKSSDQNLRFSFIVSETKYSSSTTKGI